MPTRNGEGGLGGVLTYPIW
ncbi:hypothetical protein QR680_007031 [Steinernema hermaphroditum]|uniref:Uncharacterized protein n=1 Tax=Steinernema hermaphroditum TaxID=289476 RepID=A0AA39HYW5_9BILA|nr:hypothetical protein QR680_007031 [Steinernema hermaphroditum]